MERQTEQAVEQEMDQSDEERAAFEAGAEALEKELGI
jgi:hypothetical protein